MTPEEIKSRIEGTRATLEAERLKEALPTQIEETTPENALSSLTGVSDNALTLEGRITKTSGMTSAVSSAKLSKFTMNLKGGGSLTGELQLTFLNRAFLSALAQVDANGFSKDYTVVISIEEHNKLTKK